MLSSVGLILPRRRAMPMHIRSARRKEGAASVGGLLHDLVRVDAPEVAALDPAGVVGGVDAAPVAAAFEEPRDDAGLRAGDRWGGRIGLVMQRADAAFEDDG